MKLNLYLVLLVGSLIPSYNASGQLAPSSNIGSGYDARDQPTGIETGYHKVGTQNINTKQQLRLNCASRWGGSGSLNPYSADSIVMANQYPLPTQTNSKCVLMLNNVDSSSRSWPFETIGKPIQVYNGSWYTVYGQLGHQVNKSCNRCLNNTLSFGHPAYNPLRFLNEFALDTSLSTEASVPIYFTVDSGVNSITLFHGWWGIFVDSLSFQFKNIPPPIIFQNPSFWYSIKYSQTEIYHSRIYRYQEYSSINSPEASNKAVIIGLKNKPVTYHPGYVDKENDSIRVEPLLMPISIKRFHPNFICPTSQLNLDTPTQQFIRHALKDSTQNVTYYPGYSPANPFGPGSSFSLNPATGAFTFTPTDTGMYYLAFRISEYRDGQLLGDIMSERIAMVVDSNADLPQITGPYNISGPPFNAATQTFTITPCSQALSFTMGATSSLPSAQIVLSSNFSLSCLGSTVTYTGQGTANPTVNFSWTPGQLDAGYHYLYLDAVDTACGPNHLPAHVSKGIIIHVLPSQILPKDTLVCTGQSYAIVPTGTFQTYAWNTGAFTPTITVNQSGAYWLAATINGCTQTDTIRVLFRTKLKLGNDTSVCSKVQPVIGVPVSAAFSSYSWNTGAGTPSITVTQSGQYILTVTDTCGVQKDTINVNIRPPVPLPAARDTTLCQGVVNPKIGVTGDSVRWYVPPSSAGTFIQPTINTTVTGSQTIYVTQTRGGCESDQKAIDLSIISKPSVDLGNDTTVCDSVALLIGPAVPTGTSIAWNTGETYSPIVVRKAGYYQVTLSNVCGSASDYKVVYYEDCDSTQPPGTGLVVGCLFIPTAFTPNGDSRNDRFTVISICPLLRYHLVIRNRRGELVFESQDIGNSWDGTFKGAPAAMDTYFWYLEFLRANTGNVSDKVKGDVLLVR